MRPEEDEVRKALEARSGAPRLTAAVAVATAVVLAIVSVGILLGARQLAHNSRSAASGARANSPGPTFQLTAPSTNVVWVLVDYANLYRSTDRGDQFATSGMPQSFGVRPSVSFVDNHNGWLLAPGSPTTQCQEAEAAVWFTPDAGASWKQLSLQGIAMSQCKEGIWFVDVQHGFISAWDQNHQPTVYRTSDGGTSWNASTLPDPADFKSMPGGFTLRVQWLKQFGGTLYLLAYGMQGAGSPYPDIPNRQYIFASTDRGTSWHVVTKVGSRAVVMVTESRWLDFTTPGQPMESSNGGQQFHQFVSDFPRTADASQFVFADSQVGYAAGALQIQRTDDGGLHWTGLPYPASTPTDATPPPASSARIAPPCSVVAGHRAYTNSQYGFSLSYPGGYTVEQAGSANPSAGWLAEFRAVDTCFLGSYPRGQVEMGIYTQDADTLTAWVSKHSVARCTDSGGFFWGVSNLKSVTAAGRDAVAFDEASTCEGPSTIHDTVLLLKSGKVFRFDWWSTDPNYTATIQGIAQQMLDSLEG